MPLFHLPVFWFGYFDGFKTLSKIQRDHWMEWHQVSNHHCLEWGKEQYFKHDVQCEKHGILCYEQSALHGILRGIRH